MYFRSLRKIVVVMILISGCLAGNGGTSSYASSGKNSTASASAGGLDAMFVLDVSYSMNQTDKDRIADEVIRMFMDMSGGKKPGWASWPTTTGSPLLSRSRILRLPAHDSNYGARSTA